ncbi:MAG: hemolysin family protein [Bacteroidales bacterium]|jgi:CBS domain containing-hemolysin-like protein
MESDELLIFILFLFLSILFSTLKQAFHSANRLRLEIDKSRNELNARMLTFISKRQQAFNLIMVIGHILTILALSLIVLAWWERVAENYMPGLSDVVVYIAAFLLLFSLILFVVEAIPLAVGSLLANRVLNLSAALSLVIYFTLYPLYMLFSLISHVFIRIFFRESPKRSYTKRFNREDLNDLVERSTQGDSPQKEDRELKLFQNALEFSQIKARECMRPRTEIVACHQDDSLQEIRSEFIESGYSKLLIYNEDIDDVVGYIKSKELFQHQGDLEGLIRTIPIFPETMSINKLLQYFINTGHSIALIVDEFGGTSGIITIEDIVEEIVGEIHDEHDKIEFYSKKLNDSEYIFSGRMEIDAIHEQYDLDLSESEEYETIAGFLLYHAERLPTKGDQIQVDNLLFHVLKVEGTRVELLKVKILEHS